METVNDIIREMRGRTAVLTHRINGSEGGFPSFDSVETDAFIVLADRLDAAYKRDLNSIVEAGEIDMRTAMDEVTRLRAALYSDGDFGKLLKERDAEIEQLKADVRELLKCLKKVYDEECTDYGTGEVYDRIATKMNGGAK